MARGKYKLREREERESAKAIKRKKSRPLPSSTVPRARISDTSHAMNLGGEKSPSMPLLAGGYATMAKQTERPGGINIELAKQQQQQQQHDSKPKRCRTKSLQDRLDSLNEELIRRRSTLPNSSTDIEDVTLNVPPHS